MVDSFKMYETLLVMLECTVQMCMLLRELDFCYLFSFIAG